MRSDTSRVGRIAAVSLVMIAATALPARAQLNEKCVVSVLNRTVKVSHDGTWVLPNIPANTGRVKARATCVDRGVTQSGESDYFTVPKNGIVTLPKIVLGRVTPIPSSLSIGPTPIALTAVGQTVQLTVTATFPDGSTKNVAPAAAGTDYTTSNSAIATISADGVLTAVASGNVVIQAINEGTPAIVMARVALSTTDTDGDGIPDDVEVALGLDPRNPVDALEDFDRDNLTNLEEYLAGTDLRNPDSDGDGLLDGDEVHKYHTNPLLADTDGDLIPDGVEVRTGTNPLDRTSYDLKKATASFTVQPTSFLLTTNPLLGDVSQQLSFVVNLIDGKTTLDLTADPRTSYTSNNLPSCNFSAQPGRVFAGQPGGCKITIANSTLSTFIFGLVKAFAPTALSVLPMPGAANSVAVSGDYVYVAAGSAGLQIVDVSSRVSPVIVASQHLPGNANDVVVAGPFAYVAAGSAGLQIVSIANPLAPTVTASIATGSVAWDVVVKGSRAYVANGAGGLVVIDVSTPATPHLLGTLPMSGTAKGVDVDVARQIAVVARGTDGIAVVDVSTPAALKTVALLAGGDVRDVAIAGRVALLADIDRSLTAVDLTNPAAPIVTASTPLATGGRLQDVAVAGTIAAGADVFFVNGVPLFDITDPSNPVPKAIIDFSKYFDDNATGIAIDASYVYMTAERDLTENAITATTRLYIGQYRSDDVTPPTVSIESPADGSSAVEGSTLQVAVDAADNFAVASVSVLVDGTVAATSTSAPYVLPVTVPVGASATTLQAQATDFAGNVGASAPITVVVARDTDKPVVTITAPKAPLLVPEGSVITTTVNATDNVSVTRVEFLLNDLIVATKTSPPYEAFITLPLGPAAFRFGARAYDPAGNVGVAAEVLVGVTSDPAPTVRIVAPTAGTTVTEGQRLQYTIDATDNGAVISTEFDIAIDGTIVYRDLLNKRQNIFAVPIGTDHITLLASATDNLGQVGNAPPVDLHVVPEPAPTVTFVSPTADSVLVGGSTVTVQLDATDDSAVQFVAVDGLGALFAPPYQFVETVSAFQSAANVNLDATAVDDVGKAARAELSLPVVPDALTTIAGVVVDASGSPVAGADVVAATNGLLAEFFRLPTAVTALPDLSGKTPDAVKLVSSPAFPWVTFDAFGLDSIVPGASGDPNTAIRLRGTLNVPAAGSYTFMLRAYAAGRLKINGTIIDLPTLNTDSASQDATATLVLPAGDTPIEIVTVASFGSSQVLLQWGVNGGPLQGIPLDAFTPVESPYRTTSDIDGSFSIANVPTVVGAVGATAALDAGASTLVGASARIDANPGDITNVGVIQLSTPVQPAAVPISVVPLGGPANSVDTHGDYAYVAAGAVGLVLVNVADPTHPYQNSEVWLPGNANDVRVMDDLAYVAAGTGGLQIVDVSNAESPVAVGSVDVLGEAWDVALNGATAYVAAGASGLTTVDATSPQQPARLGSLALPGIAKGVDVDPVRALAIVALGPGGVAVVDVSDPTQPRLSGTVSVADARDVAVVGRGAVIATPAGLVRLDVTNPAEPRVTSVVAGAAADVKTVGAEALAASFSPADGALVRVVDVHDPANPNVINTIGFGGLAVDEPPAAVTGIAVGGPFVYEAAASNAAENAADGTGFLFIGQYAVPQDTLGIAPVALFSNAAPGGTVTQVGESRLSLSISATDDVALAAIVIRVNGTEVSRTSIPPSRVWRGTVDVPIPTAATSVTLTLEASDVGGNTSTRSVLVDVAPYLPSPSSSIGYASVPAAIAADGSSVWVTLPDNTDGFGVGKFDLSFASLLTPAAGHHRSTYVAIDGQHNAWVSNVDNDSVVEISPQGSALQIVHVPGPGNLVADASHVWVVSGLSQIVELNASNASVAALFNTTATRLGPIAFDGANLWAIDAASNTVLEIDASSGAPMATVPTGAAPSALAFDGAFVWVTNHDAATITKIRAADAAPVGTYPTGRGPSGVATDGVFVWVTNTDDSNASKIRATDGAALGTIFTGQRPTAISLAAHHLWIVNSATGTVFLYED